MTIAAGDNQVNADIEVDIDRSKLDATARSTQDQPAHVNTTLAAVPGHALGFLGVSGLRRTADTLLRQYGADPQAQDLLRQLGLDGPAGLVAHLNGDLGIEATTGTGGTPAAALLFGVDSRTAAQTFLDRLAVMALNGGPAGPSTATTGEQSIDAQPAADPAAVPPLVSETYRGVRITSLGSATGSGAFSPAYAVLDRLAVVGTSTAAVHAVIDASLTGQTLAASPTYGAALAGRTSNNGEAFVDFDAVVAAIRSSMSGPQRTDFDSSTAPRLRPLRTLAYTIVSHSDHVSGRLSLLLH